MISYDLTGKVALVTGASHGLGVDFATVLAQYGADVAIAARRKEKLVEVAAGISEATGRTIVPVSLDVASQESIDEAVAQVMAEFGRIDILVNNAGSITYGRPETTTREAWDHEMGIDVAGVYFLSQAVYNASMQERGGHIVNVASVGGVRASDNAPIYSIAKAAVMKMTEVLALAWAKDGVYVNAIAPGNIKVGMGEATPADREAAFAAKVPQRRLGTHGDLDGALVYLCSDACSYTQGQTIVVDGGLILPLA